MGMIVPLKYIRSQEGRELQSFGWYLAVRRENSQGVKTPIGVLFRKELKDGAAVLAYLRRRLRMARPSRGSLQVVPQRAHEVDLGEANGPYEVLTRGDTFRAVRGLLRRLMGDSEPVRRQRQALLLYARNFSVEEIDQAIPKGRSAYLAARRKLRALMK